MQRLWLWIALVGLGLVLLGFRLRSMARNETVWIESEVAPAAVAGRPDVLVEPRPEVATPEREGHALREGAAESARAAGPTAPEAPPGLRLHGILCSSRDRRPLPNVRLSFVEDNEPHLAVTDGGGRFETELAGDLWVATSDEEGRAHLRLDEWPTTLRVEAEGFASDTWDVPDLLTELLPTLWLDPAD